MGAAGQDRRWRIENRSSSVPLPPAMASAQTSACSTGRSPSRGSRVAHWGSEGRGHRRMMQTGSKGRAGTMSGPSPPSWVRSKERQGTRGQDQHRRHGGGVMLASQKVPCFTPKCEGKTLTHPNVKPPPALYFNPQFQPSGGGGFIFGEIKHFWCKSWRPSTTSENQFDIKIFKFSVCTSYFPPKKCAILSEMDDFWCKLYFTQKIFSFFPNGTVGGLCIGGEPYICAAKPEPPGGASYLGAIFGVGLHARPPDTQ